MGGGRRPPICSNTTEDGAPTPPRPRAGARSAIRMPLPLGNWRVSGRHPRQGWSRLGGGGGPGVRTHVFPMLRGPAQGGGSQTGGKAPTSIPKRLISLCNIRPAPAARPPRPGRPAGAPAPPRPGVACPAGAPSLSFRTWPMPCANSHRISSAEAHVAFPGKAYTWRDSTQTLHQVRHYAMSTSGKWPGGPGANRATITGCKEQARFARSRQRTLPCPHEPAASGSSCGTWATTAASLSLSPSLSPSLSLSLSLYIYIYEGNLPNPSISLSELSACLI